MTLGDIKNHIFRRTKTTATQFSAADMTIAINNALERVESLIRTYLSNYDATRFTVSDLNTGTAVPKFNSRFHELLALWPEYQYAVENGYQSANAFFNEIQIKERELEEFYGLRNWQVVTGTIASPGVFTLNSHRLSVGDRVIFETSGALPTGLTAETFYYVINEGLSDHTFRLSATRDASAINTSGSQSGTHWIAIERQGGLRAAYEDNR